MKSLTRLLLIVCWQVPVLITGRALDVLLVHILYETHVQMNNWSLHVYVKHKDQNFWFEFTPERLQELYCCFFPFLTLGQCACCRKATRYSCIGIHQ